MLPILHMFPVKDWQPLDLLMFTEHRVVVLFALQDCHSGGSQIVREYFSDDSFESKHFKLKDLKDPTCWF
jgi:hypothetical protein